MRNRIELFSALLDRVREAVDGESDSSAKLLAVCQLLRDDVAHYDWVGFYLTDESGQTLVLGPFAGEPTEHVQIPFGRGVCGQAAQRRETVLVQDVSQEANYLSCSTRVKSVKRSANSTLTLTSDHRSQRRTENSLRAYAAW